MILKPKILLSWQKAMSVLGKCLLWTGLIIIDDIKHKLIFVRMTYISVEINTRRSLIFKNESLLAPFSKFKVISYLCWLGKSWIETFLEFLQNILLSTSTDVWFYQREVVLSWIISWDSQTLSKSASRIISIFAWTCYFTKAQMYRAEILKKANPRCRN